jgi:hypothetical protein
VTKLLGAANFLEKACCRLIQYGVDQQPIPLPAWFLSFYLFLPRSLLRVKDVEAGSSVRVLSAQAADLRDELEIRAERPRPLSINQTCNSWGGFFDSPEAKLEQHQKEVHTKAEERKSKTCCHNPVNYYRLSSFIYMPV